MSGSKVVREYDDEEPCCSSSGGSVASASEENEIDLGGMSKYLVKREVEHNIFPYLINSELVSLSKALYGKGDNLRFN